MEVVPERPSISEVLVLPVFFEKNVVVRFCLEHPSPLGYGCVSLFFFFLVNNGTAELSGFDSRFPVSCPSYFNLSFHWQ